MNEITFPASRTKEQFSAYLEIACLFADTLTDQIEEIGKLMEAHGNKTKNVGE